ncbi:Putative excisionase [Chitinophaga eiseniae]|uniref:Putative excisionase n=1 Tax=Chitinophaga eiseniae TaxID=634771 RepID=A0A1T4SPS6_9BACT|nr:excisionase family protein [Chitinophaga eiseniae]SKA30202.1 Putative excisionase [Chitinophaga eiseniae]
MSKETNVLAKAIAKELLNITNFSTCEWITEDKLLAELPFTKRSLQKYRHNGLQQGYHYKPLSPSGGGGTDERGRKVFIYHRGRMVQFVEDL